ncbi:MAG: DUF1574 family protein [Spirochaetota bacterium]
MKKFYIYYPILFLIFFFLFDKIFLHPLFHKKFVQDGNIVFYVHREQLFARMQKKRNKANTKKLLVAFGDSRAYPFSKRFMKPEQSKIWDLYNFSGPQAVPAYSYFWLQRMVRAKIVPERIFFVVSPEGFDDKKSLMHKPFLRMASTDEFAIENWSNIPKSDRYEFLVDKLIALRSVDLDYKLFWERWKSDTLLQYDPKYNAKIAVLNLYQGEYFGYTKAKQKEELERDAQRLANIYFYNFAIHETQFVYTEKLLALAEKHSSKVVVIWPKVYPTYGKKYQFLRLKDGSTLNLRKTWGGRMKKLVEKYGMLYIDMNQSSDCKLFYDASHQSGLCFPKQMQQIFALYEKNESEENKKSEP